MYKIWWMKLLSIYASLRAAQEIFSRLFSKHVYKNSFDLFNTWWFSELLEIVVILDTYKLIVFYYNIILCITH